MRSKIKLNEQSGRTVAEVFDDFVFAQTAEGLSEVTIRNYKLHLHSISKHLDIQQPMKELTNRQLEEMIVSMRKSGLAHNSISAYARVFRTFLNWCQRQGVASLTMPRITDKEIVKEIYTDEELVLLLSMGARMIKWFSSHGIIIISFRIMAIMEFGVIRDFLADLAFCVFQGVDGYQDVAVLHWFTPPLGVNFWKGLIENEEIIGDFGFLGTCYPWAWGRYAVELD